MATSVVSPAEATSDVKKRIPITVLSGFLGSGKTSFIQHAISNTKGTKFGLLINDMASVNVDSKLIRSQSSGMDGVETLELQNGCVCCTLAEDLLFSVAKLVEIATTKGSEYDHILVECSGIAEPRKIRELFHAAEDYGEQMMETVSLDTLVTIVDATIFLKLFGTDADVKTHATLAVSDNDPTAPMIDDFTGMRKITDLLLEQVECADTILINKIDLLSQSQNLDLVKKVIKNMNPNARVLSCVRGEVDPTAVVGSAKGLGAVSQGILDEHRTLIDAVESGKAMGSKHGEEGHVCDSTCEQHDHDHTHAAPSPVVSGAKAHDGECAGSECTHPSHDHDHSHDNNNSDCGFEQGQCNDPTHDHSHTHDHVHADSDETTAKTRFGITSFVYKRRRPFHPARFTLFLKSLGQLSMQGLSDYSLPESDTSENTDQSSASMKRTTTSKDLMKDLLNDVAMSEARRSLLRSKGFVWMATSAAAAYYMSHAGQFLELVVLGRWWADIQQGDWPEESVSEILRDFDDSSKHGDRRQELVFIGQFSDDAKNDGKSQKALEGVLDSCLLTDEEMSQYEEIAPKGADALRTLWFKDN
eukprot:CAMPEP_0182432108 /NCGR_PEP_ID=MMETSP1167-20130531/54184_1 /TAXON_ID=2988 /ORGANISM="Mallomonas Sp, Strain CCMP3275" /LENGTH=586 /DNA_ID=CAMNT_0024619241 /DNA_START=179 /DNA_END=1939 /DNA_ORIENTATION=+